MASVSSKVAPFTGAWIEICYNENKGDDENVAPFTGAWIEILPKRAPSVMPGVAPFTGAWIEIPIYFDEADFIYKGNKRRLKYLVVKELLPFQIFKSDSA